jgi:hypothetical protein
MTRARAPLICTQPRDYMLAGVQEAARRICWGCPVRRRMNLAWRLKLSSDCGASRITESPELLHRDRCRDGQQMRGPLVSMLRRISLAQRGTQHGSGHLGIVRPFFYERGPQFPRQDQVHQVGSFFCHLRNNHDRSHSG